MEILDARLNALKKALTRLEAGVNKFNRRTYTDYEEFRESLIQRFEYCADGFWKTLKLYIHKIYKTDVDIPTPRAIYKKARDLTLVNDLEYKKLEKMVEDRNQTSHAYEEDVAEAITQDIPDYYTLMKTITDRLILPEKSI